MDSTMFVGSRRAVLAALCAVGLAGAAFAERVCIWPEGRMPDARLLLIGQGEDEDMLRTIAREYGLGKRVRFAGVVEDVAGWLGAADFFLFP